MNEPAVTVGNAVEYEPPPGDLAPSAAEVALAAYRAGVAEGRPLTLIYAPTVLQPANQRETAAHAADAPTQRPVSTAVASRRRFTLPELCFAAGIAVTTSGAVAVALSIAAGDPSFLLGIPTAAGGAIILGSAAAINREENPR